MLTLKYCKQGTAVFISHIDTLRLMVRAIRRTGIAVDFSKGFNPHMLLFFSPPLALGLSSEAEYVTIDVKGEVSPDEMLKRYNEVCGAGFEATACFYTPNNPNLAGKTVAADYFMPASDATKAQAAVEAVTNATEYVVTYPQKGTTVSKNVRDMIMNIRATEGGVLATLATGNTNLRADRLGQGLNTDFGLDIPVTGTKKRVTYVNVGDKLVDADDYLKSLGV